MLSLALAVSLSVSQAGCAENEPPVSEPVAPAPSLETPIPQPVSAPDLDALGDNYSQFAAVVAYHQAMSERLARVSRRLRVANAPLCRLTRLDAGLSTHRLDDYPPSIRQLALHFMPLEDDGRFVRSVVPGSPADQADIRPGEEIVSGWPIRDGRPLVLDAGQGSLPIALDADEACVAPAFVINSETLNAGTDGREIELSTALVEAVRGDAALAFIVAHEMAHVIRGHRPDGPRWEAELEADRDALTLMRNAGYDIAETVAGWEAGVEIHRESQSLSPTHPPLDIRLANLEAELARLDAMPDGVLELAERP